MSIPVRVRGGKTQCQSADNEYTVSWQLKIAVCLSGYPYGIRVRVGDMGYLRLSELDRETGKSEQGFGEEGFSHAPVHCFACHIQPGATPWKSPGIKSDLPAYGK